MRLALVTAIVLISAAGQAKNNKGFLAHDSADCRPTAEIARRSTFRIILPTIDTVTIQQAFGNDTPEIRKKLITTLAARNLPAPKADDMNRWQIGNCIHQQATQCPFSKTYTSASMVLLGDGLQAVTAFHNLKLLLNDYIAKWKSRGFSSLTIAQTLNNSHLPLFVYDYKGRLVASPENLSVQIQGISAEQIAIASQNLDSNDYHSAFDRVTLKLSRSFGKGVKIATRVPKAGETVRLFGYPTATQDRKGIAASDSDGSSFYCTVGQVITPEDAARRTQWALSKLPPSEELLYRTETIFATNDAVSGNSGGPLFNADGELVAVLSRGNNKPRSTVATGTIVIPKVLTSVATNP